MGFYFGETILRARAQYRAAAADGQDPAAAGEWQQADFTAAELTEHSNSAAAPYTLSAGCSGTLSGCGRPSERHCTTGAARWPTSER